MGLMHAGDAPGHHPRTYDESGSRWDRFGAAELDALADALGSHVPRTEAQAQVVWDMREQIGVARRRLASARP